MITNEYIAKIEGHGSLKVDWNENKVQLHINEGERLFEGILVGRTDEEAHWITPRICGICPISHNLATLAAIEDAYKIKINETSRLLRNLMMCGQMIQSHVLHLFFLALPDYINIDKGTDLAKKNPKAFKRALQLKEFGDKITCVVAGRNIHPVTTTIGGFHKIPEKKDLEKILENLKETKKSAEWVTEFFSKIKYPELKVDLELVVQQDDKIISNKNNNAIIKEYKQNIEEELRKYSTAKFGKYQNREIMVGALARLALSKSKFSTEIDFQNPFHNNIGQAIEILRFHQEAEEIIEELLNMEMEATIAVNNDNSTMVVEYKGIGAIEAPRGGLYHEIYLDENGIITYANIITPTVQNLTSIEKSARVLLEQTINLERKDRERLLNMLIRAYDPCITCSVH